MQWKVQQLFSESLWTHVLNIKINPRLISYFYLCYSEDRRR